MKRPVEIEILGQRLTVASDDGEAHAREIAESVDTKARELWKQYPRASLVQIALLTALNAASEYWRLDHDRKDTDQRIERLTQQLDAELGEG